eukprot:gene729-902_t
MNPRKKAVAFMLLNCLTFTVSMSINKLVNPAIPVPVKVFIRAVFGLLFCIPLIFQYGPSIIQPVKLRPHIVRVLLTTLAMGATYFTYTQLPFTIAIPLGFTGPIFTAVLAYFILKDRLSVGQWLAIFVGYMGILLVMNPRGVVNYAVFVAIIGNIIAGLNLLYTKKLTQVDARSTIIVLGNMGIVLTTFIWSCTYWVASKYDSTWLSTAWMCPSGRDLQLLLVMGGLGLISQVAHITALKHASPSFLSLFEYSRIIFSVPIGLLLGEAWPGFQEMMGIGLILATTVYNAWQGDRSLQAQPKS